MGIRSELVMTGSLAGAHVLSACAGSDQPGAVETAPEEASDAAVGEDGDEASMDDDSMDHADDEGMGEPADAAEAPRTIAVETFDMAFHAKTIG